MRAIPNSLDAKNLNRRQLTRTTGVSQALIWTFFLVAGIALAALNTGAGQSVGDAKAASANRVEQTFESAKSRYQSETNNAEAQWQFGRACYDWADYATSSDKRAQIAQLGIAACRSLVQKNSKSAPGHYYLGMNLGQLADAKRGLEGLKIVGQMEDAFSAALALDAAIDSGGPDRNLGLLYLQTPGWPISIGSKAKAKQHLLAAVKVAPDSPENHLNLIEALLKWGDKPAALKQLKALGEIWDAARAKLTGEAWTVSWADWEARREAAQKKAGEIPKTAVTPRK